MKYYLAPMEGLTGFIVRNAYHNHFDHIDKYYTPFIPAASRMNYKIERDILPENNKGMKLIPQIMTNKAEEIVDFHNQVKDYGYHELNVNIGCPSGTVVSKRRGSGLLKYPDQLDYFLKTAYEQCGENGIKLTVKTRIGFESLDEWKRLLDIYCRYDLGEIIIHPRLRQEFYKGSPHLEAYEEAVNNLPANIKISYNGDVFSKEFHDKIIKDYPRTDSIMVGRGLFAYPGLLEYTKTGQIPDDYKNRLKTFHDEIFNGHLEIFDNRKDAMFRMKEIWSYLIKSFVDGDKYLKDILKSQTEIEYNLNVKKLFSNCDIRLQ